MHLICDDLLKSVKSTILPQCKVSSESKIRLLLEELVNNNLKSAATNVGVSHQIKGKSNLYDTEFGQEHYLLFNITHKAFGCKEEIHPSTVRESRLKLSAQTELLLV